MSNEESMLEMGAKEEGKGLKHMPSFDKFMNEYGIDKLDTEEHLSNAVTAIQAWTRKLAKMRAIKRSLVDASESCATVLNVISSMSNVANMTTAREMLSQTDFVNNLSKFLLLLPRDPSLKNRNKLARSVKTVTFSLLIAQFPQEVFEHAAPQDFSIDEKNCELASKVVLFSFRRLCKSIIANESLASFRWAFLGYRHSIRYFLDMLDIWRRCDSERVRAQLEMSYMEAYAMHVASQMTLERLENSLASLSSPTDDPRIIAQRNELLTERETTSHMIDTAHAHIVKFKRLLSQQQSEEGLQSRLEELEAHIRSSLKVYPVDTPDITAPAPAPREETQVVADLLADYTPAITVESYAKEMNQLQRIEQLCGYTMMHLIHELAMNPAYQLPLEGNETSASPTQDDHTIFTSSLRSADTDGASKALKRHLLRVMKDRMISLLTLSSHSTPEDIVRGRAYPIDFGVNHGNHVYMMAVVTEIHLSEEAVTVEFIIDNKTEKIPISRIKRTEHGIDPSLFLSSLKDIREQIAMIIPSRNDVHQMLASAIDVPLLTQMIQRDALNASDVLRIFTSIVETLLSLQSPVRAEQTLAWFRQYQALCNNHTSFQDIVAYIPDFFEVASLRLEELRTEMANVYLSMLSPFAQRHGSNLLRYFFFQQLSTGRITSLPNVLLFVTKDVCASTSELDSSLNVLRDCGLSFAAQDVGQVRECDFALLVLSMAKLISAPFDFGAPQNAAFLPVTFVYDGVRLRNIRNDIDGLALVSTLVISVRQTILGLRIPLTSKNESDLQIILTKALRNKDVNFIYLVDQVKYFIYSVWDHRSVAENAARPSLPDNWEGTLVQTMQRCVTKDNAVLELFTKRVHKVMILGVLNQPYEDKLIGWSMNSKIQAQLMRDIITNVKDLHAFHMKTYGDVYSKVLRKHVASLQISH